MLSPSIRLFNLPFGATLSNNIHRIAICTGGGDAPGLNAVIRSVVVAASNRGWECYGIRDGFNGILFPERYSEGGVFRLTLDRVRGIAHLGGTILGSTNKGNPLHFPIKMPDGSKPNISSSWRMVRSMKWPMKYYSKMASPSSLIS